MILSLERDAYKPQLLEEATVFGFNVLGKEGVSNGAKKKGGSSGTKKGGDRGVSQKE